VRINYWKVYSRIVGFCFVAAAAWLTVGQRATLTAHAASRRMPTLRSFQAASPADARSQAGLPPNLDWSNFLPAGDGQFQTTVFCGSCHAMKVIVDRRLDTEGWNQIVRRMIDTHNAPIEADDATMIGNYLGKALSKSTPPLELPIHVNTASKEELNFLGQLSPEAVQKILDARAKSNIKNFAELTTVAGDKNIDKYKSVLVFD